MSAVSQSEAVIIKNKFLREKRCGRRAKRRSQPLGSGFHPEKNKNTNTILGISTIFSACKNILNSDILMDSFFFLNTFGKFSIIVLSFCHKMLWMIYKLKSQMEMISSSSPLRSPCVSLLVAINLVVTNHTHSTYIIVTCHFYYI